MIREKFESSKYIPQGVMFDGYRYIAKEPYIWGSDKYAFDLQIKYEAFCEGYKMAKSECKELCK